MILYNIVMQEPVPKGISQIEKNIADNVTAAGIPTRPEDVRTDPLDVLRDVTRAGGELIGEGVREGSAYIGSTLSEDIGGGVPQMHKGNRLARLGRPVKILQERMKKGVRIGGFLERLGLKKAA